jgi:hypothetical protein
VPWGATERLVALVLPRRGRPIMICPAFELGSLQADLKIEADIRLWQEHDSPAALVTRALSEIGADVLALDPAAPFSLFSALDKAAPSLRAVDATPVIDGCRGLKSPAELALMRYAKAITLEVHRHAAAVLAPGIAASAVKRFIDTAHRAAGADGGSTFCAVQFGRATAYPHGLPGDQALEEGELVLIDTGCQVEGYNADITRTYVFGEPGDEHRRIWDIEHEAQAAAFAAVRPGVPCEVIDETARRVLRTPWPGARLRPAGPAASHGPRHRPVDPRGPLPGARRQHAPGAGHVLLQRADDRHSRSVRRAAGGPFPRHRGRRGLVHRAVALDRRAVRSVVKPVIPGSRPSVFTLFRPVVSGPSKTILGVVA